MISPGTKIVCPRCRFEIATTNTFLEIDEDDGSIYIDDFNFITEELEEFTKAEGTCCPSCSAPWTDTGGYVHTDSGWQEVE